MSAYGVFWALALQEQAREAERKARAAEKRTQRVEDELRARCDRLALVCETMWTLMRDRLNLTEADLIDRLHDIDLADGKLDGKVRRPPTSCPKCARRVSQRFAHCMYCGAELPQEAF